MPLWTYEARDGAGKMVHGSHDAADRAAALQFLRGQGLFLTKLEVADGAAVSGSVGKAGSSLPPSVSLTVRQRTLLRASSQELSFYFRNIAIMLHAGTSLLAIMNSMATQAPNRALRGASELMEKRVMGGETLSESMRAFPGLFAPLHVGAVKIGERIGAMESIFDRLAKYCETDYEWRQVFQREIFPLKMVIGVRLLLVAVLLYIAVYSSHAANPLLTWLLLMLPVLLVVGLIVVGCTIAAYFSPLLIYRPKWRLWLDSVKWRNRIARKAVHGMAITKFCRALGELYGAGVGWSESVTLAAGACGNAAIARELVLIIPGINRGEKLSECLDATGLFLPMALQVIRTGEEAGHLDEQLIYAAELLEAEAEIELKKAVKKVVTILVPAAHFAQS